MAIDLRGCIYIACRHYGISATRKCPIWGIDCEVTQVRGLSYIVDSPRAGGRYLINLELKQQLLRSLSPVEDKQRAVLTTWIVEQHNQRVELPRLTQDLIDRVCDGRRRALRPFERADRLLLKLSSMGGIGKRFDWPELAQEDAVLSGTESISASDCRLLMDYLEENSLVQRQGRALHVSLQGHQKIGDLETRNSHSQVAFVAMWFDPSMDVIRDTIKDAIINVGYDPFVVDQADFGNKICDKIEAEIRNSRFLVADFTHNPKTGARGSVYYEVGLAVGLGIPVVWTCRDDQIANLHFDTRQYPHIPWRLDALPIFKDRLRDRIRVLMDQRYAGFSQSV